jgi:hypothetical protein
MDYKGKIILEGVTGGSKLTITGIAQMKGWWPLMEPFMKSEFKSGIRKELETLKAVLESAN